MKFSARDSAIIYSVLGGWLIGCILAIVNLCLISVLGSTRFKIYNFGFFALYSVSAFGLFAGWFGDALSTSVIPVIPIIGVPVFAVFHFFYLLWMRRAFRLRRKKDAI